MILSYADGETISGIARTLGTNRPRVERCIQKALDLGVRIALGDLPRQGRPTTITPEAKAWLVSLACSKPKDLGYPHELWTMDLLANHVRKECKAAGHPSLSRISRGTVCKILGRNEIKPHKVSYYLEKRDPDHDSKMAQVLCVYREVQLLRKAESDDPSATMSVTISYDEKPGIQATENSAPDLPPVPGVHSCIGRDHEYIRHGTLSLMAGIDLLSGHVHGLAVPRHRSREFIQFLQKIDAYYPQQATIRMIMDNHSAHISKETRKYLASVPNRFVFVFTPKHASWLNLIETFFSKMSRSFLRGIRVKSKEELKQRIECYLDLLNETPVVFRWKYGIEDLSVV
jgi:transposase